MELFYPGLDVLRLGHRHIGKNAICQLRAVSAVHEQRLAQEMHCGLATQFQSLRIEGLERKRQLDHRRTEKIKDICAEDRIHHLKPVHLAKLACPDSLIHCLLQFFDKRLEYLAKDERQRPATAALKAHHLLLQQALEIALCQDAVKVVQRRS